MKKNTMIFIITVMVLSLVLLSGCDLVGDKVLGEIESQVNDVQKQVEDTANNFGLIEDGEELRIVKGNAMELAVYKSKETIEEYDDEYMSGITYITKANLSDTLDYYKELLEGTEFNLFIKAPSGGVITGTISEQSLSIACEEVEGVVTIEATIEK